MIYHVYLARYLLVSFILYCLVASLALLTVLCYVGRHIVCVHQTQSPGQYMQNNHKEVNHP